MAEATAEATVADINDAIAAKAGKYLTFALDREIYGLVILKVQEIIQMQDITVVPNMPCYIRGVINLRGKVIPVVELRLKFGLETTEDTERTCIIVVQVRSRSGEVTMGIIVDEVSEVLDIAASSLEEAPSFGGTVDTEFIRGMGKIDKTVVMLLDIDKVLTDETADVVMNGVSE
jgi:purine-binding chemotaxis protein CheW